MIDFSRAQMTHFALHQVGNKGLGEELQLNISPIEFKDDFVKESVLRYFLTPFKTDIYYNFKSKHDISLMSVVNSCEDIFLSRKDFTGKTAQIATHLYNQGLHPKIKGGPLYVCFFKDVICDGELVDCVGIFKTENTETFLKLVDQGLDIDVDNGINLKKLDKGCLVFNTDKLNGYKLSIIDSNNKVAECSLYWQEDFLNAQMKENKYYHTKNFIDMSVGFCEEVLTEVNNVKKLNQNMMLNKSVSYFKDRENFNIKDFEKDVLVEKDVIQAFQDYRNDFINRRDLTSADEFEVSETAVKKNQKYMRTVIKLDKNFHLYIHGRHDLLEQGFDEEKGMKYYKTYYVNED